MQAPSLSQRPACSFPPFSPSGSQFPQVRGRDGVRLGPPGLVASTGNWEQWSGSTFLRVLLASLTRVCSYCSARGSIPSSAAGPAAAAISAHSPLASHRGSGSGSARFPARGARAHSCPVPAARAAECRVRRAPGGRRWHSLPLASPPRRAGRGRCPPRCSARRPLRGSGPCLAGVRVGAASRARERRQGARATREPATPLGGGRWPRGASRGRAGAGPLARGGAGPRLRFCAPGRQGPDRPGLGRAWGGGLPSRLNQISGPVPQRRSPLLLLRRGQRLTGQERSSALLGDEKQLGGNSEGVARPRNGGCLELGPSVSLIPFLSPSLLCESPRSTPKEVHFEPPGLRVVRGLGWRWGGNGNG